MDIQETMKRAALLLLLSFLCIKPFATEASLQLRATSSFAVLHYDAEVDPDIAKLNITARRDGAFVSFRSRNKSIQSLRPASGWCASMRRTIERR